MAAISPQSAKNALTSSSVASYDKPPTKTFLVSIASGSDTRGFLGFPGVSERSCPSLSTTAALRFLLDFGDFFSELSEEEELEEEEDSLLSTAAALRFFFDFGDFFFELDEEDEEADDDRDEEDDNSSDDCGAGTLSLANPGLLDLADFSDEIEEAAESLSFSLFDEDESLSLFLLDDEESAEDSSAEPEPLDPLSRLSSLSLEGSSPTSALGDDLLCFAGFLLTCLAAGDLALDASVPSSGSSEEPSGIARIRRSSDDSSESSESSDDEVEEASFFVFPVFFGFSPFSGALIDAVPFLFIDWVSVTEDLDEISLSSSDSSSDPTSGLVLPFRASLRCSSASFSWSISYLDSELMLPLPPVSSALVSPPSSWPLL